MQHQIKFLDHKVAITKTVNDNRTVSRLKEKTIELVAHQSQPDREIVEGRQLK